MSRSIVVAALGALTLGSGAVEAQEAPALEAPIEASADPPTPERPSRPLLVIPGVTAPRAGAAAPGVAGPGSSPPVLDGPKELAGPTEGIPLRLEAIPPTPADGHRPAARGAKDVDPPGRTVPEAPARRPGAGGGRAPGGAKPGGRDAPSLEAAEDPAVEAAVKRRVEKQVRESLGDRIKDLEVRVAGRTVLVRARASRFWYRWNARRTLNALPMPSGYRGKVELLD